MFKVGDKVKIKNEFSYKYSYIKQDVVYTVAFVPLDVNYFCLSASAKTDFNYKMEHFISVIPKKNPTFKEIMAIDISDKRTVALKFNPQAVLNEGAKLVHKDNRSNELYLIEGKDINKELEFPKIWFLKMTCPTGRVFIEGVPPEEAEKNPNSTDMQALLCGLTSSEYALMEMES